MEERKNEKRRAIPQKKEKDGNTHFESAAFEILHVCVISPWWVLGAIAKVWEYSKQNSISKANRIVIIDEKERLWLLVKKFNHGIEEEEWKALLGPMNTYFKFSVP